MVFVCAKCVFIFSFSNFHLNAFAHNELRRKEIKNIFATFSCVISKGREKCHQQHVCAPFVSHNCFDSLSYKKKKISYLKPLNCLKSESIGLSIFFKIEFSRKMSTMISFLIAISIQTFSTTTRQMIFFLVWTNKNHLMNEEIEKSLKGHFCLNIFFPSYFPLISSLNVYLWFHIYFSCWHSQLIMRHYVEI